MDDAINGKRECNVVGNMLDMKKSMKKSKEVGKLGVEMCVRGCKTCTFKPVYFLAWHSNLVLSARFKKAKNS